MLAARYAAGLPLWHHDDANDHGPGTTGNLVVDDNGTAEPLRVDDGEEDDDSGESIG